MVEETRPHEGWRSPEECAQAEEQYRQRGEALQLAREIDKRHLDQRDEARQALEQFIGTERSDPDTQEGFCPYCHGPDGHKGYENCALFLAEAAIARARGERA